MDYYLINNKEDIEYFIQNKPSSSIYQFLSLLPNNLLELDLLGINSQIFSQYLTKEIAYHFYKRAYREISKVELRAGKLEDFNLFRFYKLNYIEMLEDIYCFDYVINKLLISDINFRLFFIYHNSRPLNYSEINDTKYIATLLMLDLNKKYPDKFIPIYLSKNKDVKTVDLSNRFIKYSTVLKVFLHVSKYLKYIKHKLYLLKNHEAQIFALGSGYDALVVIEDALRLSKESNQKLLWITDSIDKTTERSGLYFNIKYNRIEKKSLLQLSNESKLPELTKDEVNETKKYFDHIIMLLDTIDVINKYKITNHLKTLLPDYISAFAHAKQINEVFKKYIHSTIVLTYCNGITEKAIEQIAYRYDIKTILRPHGWLSNMEGYEYNASSYLFDGLLWKQEYEKFFKKKIQAQLILDQGLKQHAQNWISKPIKEKDKIINYKRKRLSIKNKFVIVFMITGARTHILNEFDYHKLKKFWEIMLPFISSHPQIYCIIKSHKNNYNFWIKQKIKKYNIRNININEDRLEDILIIADLVINLGKPGSATLVSLIYNKPLLIYKGLYKYSREMGDSIHNMTNDFTIKSISELKSEIDNLIKSGEKYTSNVLKQNSLLKSLVIAS